MDRKAPCLGRGNLIAGVISVPSRNTVGFGIPELGPMPCTNSRAPFWAEFPPRAVQSYPPPPPQQCHTPPPPAVATSHSRQREACLGTAGEMSASRHMPSFRLSSPTPWALPTTIQKDFPGARGWPSL